MAGSLCGERGNVRNPERPGGNDDLASGDLATGHIDPEAITIRCRIDALDEGPAPDWQREALGVRREVVAHLAAGRIVERTRGEAESWQRVPAGRTVKAERVPALAPVIADPLVSVDDEERNAPLLQVVSRRQARLAAADDQGVDPLGLGSVRSHLTLLRVSEATGGPPVA
jgi:hypothetical protein